MIDVKMFFVEQEMKVLSGLGRPSPVRGVPTDRMSSNYPCESEDGKMKKRIISVFLSAVLVFALLPVAAWAADVPFENNGGNGTAGNPYQINDLDQFEAFRNYINADADGGKDEYFKLTAPIDMSANYSAGSNTSWTPIGTEDNPFSGTFDGGDFEISGLYINTEDYYTGLFGYSTGTIKNLTVSGSVTGGTYTGGIVGENEGGSVENCCNKNAVNGVSSTSGIAGYNKGGSIENCYNTGAVTGTGNCIGGIAGNNSGSVKNCYNTGTVSGAGYVGGIVGENSIAVIVGDSGNIKSCYNTGTVSSTNATYIGGIVGSTGGNVKYCYYLDTCGAGGRFGGTSKTTDKFASGEVAWLLQSNQDMPDQQVWGQKLSDKADGYPVLTSEESKKVLKVTFATQENEAYDAKYTNPNGTVEMPETPEKTNYTFEKWAKTQNADGDKFDAKTPVTSDMTVYAVGHDHFGGDSADITLSATYGYDAPLTVNLDEHMKYANKSVASEGKFTYAISDKGNTNASIENENTLSVPTGLNANDYTITVKATEKTPQYSLMSVEDFGTEAVTLTVKVHIAKAASSVTVKPTAKTDLTYNGTAQELVTAGETTDGTIQYSLDNADYSADIPKGTEAKTYTVWYKVVGDNNHNDSTPQSVDVTIKKTNSEVTVADSSATYGDTLTLTAEVKKSNTAGIGLMSVEQDKVDFKAGETSLGTATVEYSDGELKSVGTATLNVTVDKAKYDAIKAAEGKITAEYGGSVNLNESKKDNITVTLNKKTLTYTAAATNRKYNGETTVEVTLEPTNAKSSDTVTLTATGTIDDANAGNGKSVTITGVTVGGADAEYYEAAVAPTEAVTVNIEKADSTVTAPTSKTDLTYNGEAQELLATAGSATGGELQYKVDEGTYSTAAPKATTAGEHTVYYKVVENDNYNGIAEASIKVTIAKATPKFPTVGDVDGGTYEPDKKLSSVTVPEVDGGTLAWSDGETALNAGANSVQAVFTPANSENYEPTSIDGTVTVNVAKATITGVAVQDITAQFDETQPEKQYTLAEPTGTIEGDTVRYAEGDYNEANDREADWKETCPSYSDEGTDKTITVRIERENYNTLYLKATIKITNEPAISGVDVTANDGLVYNGGAQELVTVKGALGTDTVTYYVNDDPTGSTEKATGTNAGSYSVKVKVEREGHHHFEKTVEVTIAKADPTTVVTPKDLTYTGAAQELVTGEATGGELRYSLDESAYSADIPTGTEAKAYTVWYKVMGDANHTDTDPACITVTIAPFPLTLEPVEVETPYTGAAISVTVAQTSGQIPIIDPEKITVSYEQDGAAAEPVLPGTYDVLANLTDPNFTLTGTAKVGSLTITHVHVYAEEWTHDTEDHWHVCQGVGACDAPRSDLAAHVWDDGVVTLEPTTEAEGSRLYTCSVCGAARSEPISKVNTFQISGVVTDHDGTPLSPAAIRLTRGQETVAETVTDDHGRYSFSSVPAGLYNVAATWDTVTKTILVELSDADAHERNIQMPEGKVSSVVEVLGEDTPDVVVGGVDAIAEAETASPAETVTVTLTVEKKDTPADKAALEAAASTQAANLTYLDMTLTKTTTGAGSSEVTITDASAVLEIVIPFDFTNKTNVTAYRSHNNTAEALTKADADARIDGTFRLDEAGGKIYIYASKFSTYAIGYTPTPPAPPTYTTTVTQPEHGALEVSPAWAVAGSRVTVTVTPDAGYELGALTITDRSGNAVEYKDNGDGTFTFVMPSGGATVEAAFAPACMRDETCPLAKFTDAAPTAWYHDGVHYCVERGLMAGISATTFAPDMPTSRAMIVTILWREAGSPVVNYLMQYDDVELEAWYTEAVRWATSEGVVDGYGNGLFGPNDPITREQLAAMLWRYAKAKGWSVSVGEGADILSFEDFDQICEWAVPAIRWAAGNGIVQGKGGLLDPRGQATRAQAAAMLQRFLTSKIVPENT